MQSTSVLTILVLVFALVLLPSATSADVLSDFTARVEPILRRHCVECHGGTEPEARLDLSGPRTVEEFQRQREQWYRVMERIESGSMPPPDATPLAAAERDAVLSWGRGAFTTMLAEAQRANGRSRIRRLSRSEYAATIEDLFGFRPGVRPILPDDGRVDGFDKIADAVPFSAASADGYVRLADAIVTEALKPRPKDLGRHRAIARPSEESKGHILELPDGWMVSFNSDLTSGPLQGFKPRVPGRHRLRIQCYGFQTDTPLPFGVYAGPGGYPQILELVEILDAPPGGPAVVEAEIYFRTSGNGDLTRGGDTFRLVPLGLGVPVPKNHQASECTGPGLALQGVDIEEPEWPPPQIQSMLDCMSAETVVALRKFPHAVDPVSLRAACVADLTTLFRRVAPRFFRRDLTAEEWTAVEQVVVAAYDAGQPPRNPLAAALEAGLTALLTAPEFLCLITEPGRLDDFALASRLSYFLWNSCPDDELLRLARERRLSDPVVLAAQTKRLLADPRSDRFVKEFGNQWLGLWGIDSTTPDKDVYPEYDELLRFSSLLETRATLRTMIDENRSVVDMVAPDWAIVNGRLANHYGFSGVAGVALQRIHLPADSFYGGLWTQPAPMKVTANGTITSPVKRGVWVAERLLGVRIPPPPSNIDPVVPDTRGATTLREQLALHSGQGSCRACHAKFDAYGFALESFDVTGGFRERYRIPDPVAATRSTGAAGQGPGTNPRLWREGPAVDASGTTPQGAAFADIRELRGMIAADPGRLARGVARHLVTYATGAAATPADDPAIDAIVREAAANGFGFASLIHAVVQSDVFRHK
jgi:hypothetical protein